MALELRDVTFAVGGETHIYQTSLSLEPGGFNILLGTTLSGKTTLMQLMAGLRRPTTGTVWHDGRDVTSLAVQKRNVSMVYQQFINYPNYSVFDNIASPLRVAGVASAEIKKRVGEMAELLRLSPMLNRKPSELSGGQQQRTAMARALVKDSDLVLLDEPLANLDFKLREELRDELPRLFADRNCIVVYATTEPVEALLFAGNTATLHEGRVTQYGPTSTVYRAPRDLVSAKVFSDPPINTARVTKAGDRISLYQSVTHPTPSVLKERPDGDYLVGIRPHFVSPVKSDSSLALDGKILVTELSGSESTVHFSIDDDFWVSQAHGIHEFQVGVTARLYADLSKAMYFDSDGTAIAGETNG